MDGIVDDIFILGAGACICAKKGAVEALEVNQQFARISFTDSMGMRPDAVAMLRRDFPALQSVYDLMVDRDGIRISAVEKFLYI